MAQKLKLKPVKESIPLCDCGHPKNEHKYPAGECYHQHKGVLCECVKFSLKAAPKSDRQFWVFTNHELEAAEKGKFKDIFVTDTFEYLEGEHVKLVVTRNGSGSSTVKMPKGGQFVSTKCGTIAANWREVVFNKAGNPKLKGK